MRAMCAASARCLALMRWRKKQHVRLDVLPRGLVPVITLLHSHSLLLLRLAQAAEPLDRSETVPKCGPTSCSASQALVTAWLALAS